MGARRVALYCALMALSRWKIVRSLALSLISQKITKSTSSQHHLDFAPSVKVFSQSHATLARNITADIAMAQVTGYGVVRLPRVISANQDLLAQVVSRCAIYLTASEKR